MGIKETFFNLIKDTLSTKNNQDEKPDKQKRPTRNLIVNGKNVEYFPLRSGTREGHETVSFLFKPYQRGPRQYNEATKIKVLQIEKKE